MSAFTNLRSWVNRRLRGARALSEPIAAVPENRFFGLGSGTQQDPNVLLHEAIGWAAIAVRAIADRVAGLRLEVCREERIRGRMQLSPLDDHPLAKILGAGNPVHSPRSLQRLIAQHLLTLGEAYLFKVRGTFMPVPVELWIGNPAAIRPVVDGPMIVAFEVYDGNGARQTVAREDVVRIWWPDPEAVFTAEGLLGPQWITADAMKFSGQTLRSHFESNAIPRVIMESTDQAAALDDGAVDRLNAYFRQRFDRRSGSSRGLPAWLPSGFKAHELAALGGVDEVVGILDHWVDQTLAAFGVPRSSLGLTDDAGLGRATAETNEYVMDKRAVQPVTDAIGDAMTYQLARPDFGDDLVVRFPDFAPKDKDFELKRRELELRTKLRSINQVLEADGEPPVPWGNLPVGSIGEAPYTGEVVELEPDDPDALEDDDDQGDDEPEDDDERGRALEDLAPLARGNTDQQRAAVAWSRFVARERAFVPRADAAIRAIFGIQERTFLKALRDAEPERRRVQQRVDVAQIQELVRAVFDGDRWRALFERRFEPVRRAAFLQAGQDALALVGGEPASFTLSQRTAELLLGQAEEFRRLVSSTTIKRVSAAVVRELAEGAAAGESASQRAKRVENAVGDAMQGRRRQALTIARTEMLTATQRAQIEGFRSSGVVVGKRWGTSRDDAVRDSHQIEGQTVPLDDAFLLPADPDRNVPAERAAAPGVGAGGGRLSAANTINCRCFVRPVLEGDL